MEKKNNLSKRVNHYDIFEVIDTFNIQKNRECLLIKEWMSAKGTISTFDTQLIDHARKKLQLKWDEWNEEELKMHFISLVFFVAQLDEPNRISTFYERKFAGKVNDFSISLIVDCMIASPTNSGRPKSPYFFLQERNAARFKQSLGDGHDPEGQMLAAMILSQEINKDNKPIYGCWLQGKNWNFTVLNGLEYCVSSQFDATDPNDLLQIVFVLRKLKELILGRDAA